MWRQGGADNGRDIEAYLTVNNNFIGPYEERYFIECKKYSKGVPPNELNSKVAWADAEKPQHLIFMISSYLTNNARDWLDKIRKNKSYKIHVLEGKHLKKMISLHQKLIEKYFIDDVHLNLLNDSIKLWVMHNLTPNFLTHVLLLENIDTQILSINKIIFLFMSYYCNYEPLEKLENKKYHDIDISSYLEDIEHRIKEYYTHKQCILEDIEYVELIGGHGTLDILEFDILESDFKNFNYNFISTTILVASNNRKNPNLAYYMFKRINKKEAIEILLLNNSSLDYKIRYISDYNFNIYKNSLKYLYKHNYRGDDSIKELLSKSVKFT